MTAPDDRHDLVPSALYTGPRRRDQIREIGLIDHLDNLGQPATQVRTRAQRGNADLYRKRAGQAGNGD